MMMIENVYGGNVFDVIDRVFGIDAQLTALYKVLDGMEGDQDPATLNAMRTLAAGIKVYNEALKAYEQKLVL